MSGTHKMYAESILLKLIQFVQNKKLIKQKGNRWLPIALIAKFIQNKVAVGGGLEPPRSS
jgi:hypothetical protein